jgi:hypothetical protein
VYSIETSSCLCGTMQWLPCFSTTFLTPIVFGTQCDVEVSSKMTDVIYADRQDLSLIKLSQDLN